MVQILEPVPSFGQQLARGLGAGVTGGLGKASELFLENAKQKAKVKQLHEFVNGTGEGESTAEKLTPKDKDERFMELAQLAEDKGVDLSPRHLDELWKFVEDEAEAQSKQRKETPKLSREQRERRELAAGMLDPTTGKLMVEQRKLSERAEQAREAAVDKSYEMQKDFIGKKTSQYEGFSTEMKPRLLQMQSLNDDELIGPGAAQVLEKMGIPLGVLENPSNELYSKLSQDLLKGLPDTYGNRILKVEVENFLKTIPQLINSADGRRMIASNMLKLGEMKEIFYKEMRRQQMDYLDSGEKFPKDFQQRVFDNVQPQIDRLNQQFVRLADVKEVPEGTVPFFGPDDQVTFIPKDPQALKWAKENGGRRIW